MNSAARKFAKALEEDIQAKGGIKDFRIHALKNLELKTIIRESHKSPVSALEFNPTSEDLNGLVASVGGNQATAYNSHYLEHYINVVAQFTNEETTIVPGGDLYCCAWLQWDDSNASCNGDAILAVSGSDAIITIIHLVESRVICALRGHVKPVICLSAPRNVPGLVASMSKDGELRIWNAFSEECLLTNHIDARAMEFGLSGESIYLGTKKGAVIELRTPLIRSDDKLMKIKKDYMPEAFRIDDLSRTDPVEALRALTGFRLAIKWLDGTVLIWDSLTKAQVARFKVPGCGLGFGGPGSGLSATADGEVICAGNYNSSVFLYETRSGTQISHIDVDRLKGSVQCCAISNNCTHVLACLGNGFIFRFEYNPENRVEKEQLVDSVGDRQDGGAPVLDGA